MLYDLQRVLGMARNNETEFIAMLQEKSKRMTKKIYPKRRGREKKLKDALTLLTESFKIFMRIK